MFVSITTVYKQKCRCMMQIKILKRDDLYICILIDTFDAFVFCLSVSRSIILRFIFVLLNILQSSYLISPINQTNLQCFFFI